MFSFNIFNNAFLKRGKIKKCWLVFNSNYSTSTSETNEMYFPVFISFFVSFGLCILNSIACLFWTVHGKTRDEWHRDDIRIHTSDIWLHTNDIRVTDEYIRMIYEWHTDDIRVHTGDIRVHTGDIRVHTSDIRMTYEYIQMTYECHMSTYEWHTNDMRMACKVIFNYIAFEAFI